MSKSGMTNAHLTIRGVMQLPFSLASNVASYFYNLYTSLANGSKYAQTHILQTPSNSRVWLVEHASATMTLPDGRTLGYAQYGSPNGRPIIYCHGLPGSRVEGGHFQDLGTRLGVRVIAVDRPGVGWSSPHPGATILDHARDIEALTKHLGLEEFGVMVTAMVACLHMLEVGYDNIVGHPHTLQPFRP